MFGERNTSGAVYMKRNSNRKKTTMIGAASMRCVSDRLEGFAIAASAPLLQSDQVFGELDHRHVLRKHLAHHPSAIEDEEAVGHLVHVREIMLDVDAGASR